ncbi:hypothetical protein AWB74_05008 [Caballeronia arvi]|uniref:Uncharacterized protein n=1 Tax=Caballeronia arvi TaxID=1777135 RepID=A0A158K6X0_9BURK|nr:hypothetical protein AWB74_05008 [Caballeronia arvi]
MSADIADCVVNIIDMDKAPSSTFPLDLLPSLESIKQRGA